MLNPSLLVLKGEIPKVNNQVSSLNHKGFGFSFKFGCSQLLIVILDLVQELVVVPLRINLTMYRCIHRSAVQC